MNKLINIGLKEYTGQKSRYEVSLLNKKLCYHVSTSNKQ